MLVDLSSPISALAQLCETPVLCVGPDAVYWTAARPFKSIDCPVEEDGRRYYAAGPPVNLESYLVDFIQKQPPLLDDLLKSLAISDFECDRIRKLPSTFDIIDAITSRMHQPAQQTLRPLDQPAAISSPAQAIATVWTLHNMGLNSRSFTYSGEDKMTFTTDHAMVFKTHASTFVDTPVYRFVARSCPQVLEFSSDSVRIVALRHKKPTTIGAACVDIGRACAQLISDQSVAQPVHIGTDGTMTIGALTINPDTQDPDVEAFCRSIGVRLNFYPGEPPKPLTVSSITVDSVFPVRSSDLRPELERIAPTILLITVTKAIAHASFRNSKRVLTALQLRVYAPNMLPEFDHECLSWGYATPFVDASPDTPTPLNVPDKITLLMPSTVVASQPLVLSLYGQFNDDARHNHRDMYPLGQIIVSLRDIVQGKEEVLRINDTISADRLIEGACAKVNELTIDATIQFQRRPNKIVDGNAKLINETYFDHAKTDIKQRMQILIAKERAEMTRLPDTDPKFGIRCDQFNIAPVPSSVLIMARPTPSDPKCVSYMLQVAATEKMLTGSWIAKTVDSFFAAERPDAALVSQMNIVLTWVVDMCSMIAHVVEYASDEINGKETEDISSALSGRNDDCDGLAHSIHAVWSHLRTISPDSPCIYVRSAARVAHEFVSGTAIIVAKGGDVATAVDKYDYTAAGHMGVLFVPAWMFGKHLVHSAWFNQLPADQRHTLAKVYERSGAATTLMPMIGEGTGRVSPFRCPAVLAGFDTPAARCETVASVFVIELSKLLKVSCDTLKPQVPVTVPGTSCQTSAADMRRIYDTCPPHAIGKFLVAAVSFTTDDIVRQARAASLQLTTTPIKFLITPPEMKTSGQYYREIVKGSFALIPVLVPNDEEIREMESYARIEIPTFPLDFYVKGFEHPSMQDFEQMLLVPTTAPEPGTCFHARCKRNALPDDFETHFHQLIDKANTSIATKNTTSICAEWWQMGVKTLSGAIFTSNIFGHPVVHFVLQVK